MRKSLIFALILSVYPVIQSMEVKAKYFCCPVVDKCSPKDKCTPKVKCIPSCGKKATCQEGHELKNKYWILK